MKILPLLSILLAAAPAAAQNTAAAARSAARVSMPAIAVPPLSGAPSLNTSLTPLSGVALTPALSAPSLSVAAAPVSVAPAALQPAALVPSALAVSVKPAAAKPLVSKPAVAQTVQEAAAAPALAVLNAAASVEKPSDLGAQYDGSTARAESPAAVTAAKSPARRSSLLKRTALAAGALIMVPGAAFAQAASKVDPGLTTVVTDYAPIATALAAVIGAVIGLLSSREKDGSANAGKALSASLSYGAIAGAAVFALLDLTKFAFLGGAVAGLAPLTAAVTTAALAQTAFAAKFTDPATTPADRIVGAFPVVAAAFGLSVGAVAFLPAATAVSFAAGTMMLTGAATALYAALFRLGKSNADGPAAMGRGLTLQTLMTGLALSLGGAFSPFFFALGLWGFGTVMVTTAKELWAAAPESFRARFKR